MHQPDRQNVPPDPDRSQTEAAICKEIRNNTAFLQILVLFFWKVQIKTLLLYTDKQTKGEKTMDFRKIYFKGMIESGTMTRESYVEMRLKEDKYLPFIQALDAFEACEGDKNAVVKAMTEASGIDVFTAKYYYDLFRFRGTWYMRKDIKEKENALNEEFSQLIS